MKTNIKTFFFAVLAMAATVVSCEKPDGIETPVQDAEGLLELTFAVNADTKTALGEGQTVVWEADDVLCVYDGTKWNDFTIPAADFVEGSSSAKFTGTANDAETYYVVHSASTPAEFVAATEESDAYVLGISVPSVQTATKGTYDPEAVTSVGVATRAQGAAVTDPVALEMRNICALAKVTVTGDDIKSVTISTTDDKKYFAATSQVYIRQYPGVTAKADQSLSVTLVSGTDGAIEPGDYYIAMIPRQVTNVSVTYTRINGASATVTSTLPTAGEGETQEYYDFSRSKVVPLGIDDTALNYVLDLTLDFTKDRGEIFNEYVPNVATASKSFTLGEMNYPFTITSSKNFKYDTNTLWMNIGAASDGSIVLPAVENMTLNKVYVECNKVTDRTAIFIYESEKLCGRKMEGVNIAANNCAKSLLLYDNDDSGDGKYIPAENTSYAFCVKAADFKLTRMVVTYKTNLSE